jgi:hypothetical protein
MAEIVQTIVGDQALRLYNEQFGRRLNIGCAWGKIRVGVRFTISATSTINDSGLVLGVSQGTTDMFRSASCEDFIGGHLGATLQNTDWTYNAGPPAFASSGGFSTFAFNKVGPTVVSTAPGGSANSYLPISPTRGLFIVDIEKSHNQMRVTPRPLATQALGQTDLNFGNFVQNMENDVTILPITGSSPNVILVPYTAGRFAWDSVNVDWNNGAQPIEISDLVVVRFF